MSQRVHDEHGRKNNRDQNNERGKQSRSRAILNKAGHPDKKRIDRNRNQNRSENRRYEGSRNDEAQVKRSRGEQHEKQQRQPLVAVIDGHWRLFLATQPRRQAPPVECTCYHRPAVLHSSIIRASLAAMLVICAACGDRRKQVDSRSFGTTKDGAAVNLYKLTN